MGPLKNGIGHDLSYIALTGALHAIGREKQLPSPPLPMGYPGTHRAAERKRSPRQVNRYRAPCA